MMLMIVNKFKLKKNSQKMIHKLNKKSCKKIHKHIFMKIF
jgi:hypothetical protein